MSKTKDLKGEEWVCPRCGHRNSKESTNCGSHVEITGEKCGHERPVSNFNEASNIGKNIVVGRMSEEMEKHYLDKAEKHASFLTEKVFKPAFVMAFVHGAKHGREDLAKELELPQEKRTFNQTQEVVPVLVTESLDTVDSKTAARFITKNKDVIISLIKKELENE